MDNVLNPFTKFEDPTAIRSWVKSSDVSHRMPLTMRFQPVRMRRNHVTYAYGANFSNIFEIPDPDSLYNFYSATMTFKGRLLLAPAMLKLFFGWKFLRSKSGLKLAVFFREKVGVNDIFWFCDPKKVHLCQERRLLTYFVSKFVGASWPCVIVWTPNNSRVNNLVREVAHARKQNPLSDLDQTLQNGRYPRHNHLCKF